MKKILMVIVASLLFSSTVFALGVPIKDAEKLIGCWKRNVYSDADMKRLSKVEFYDEVQQKYQWFCFNPDGSFRVMAANKNMPIADIKEKVKNLPFLMTWKLMSPGIVRIEHKEDPSQNYNWLMSVAVSSETFKGVGINPGEVYMGLINREKTDYSLLRVLSKEK